MVEETTSIEYTDEYGETDGERREWSESEEEALEERLSSMGYLS
jgi:hypothetical protein